MIRHLNYLSRYRPPLRLLHLIHLLLTHLTQDHLLIGRLINLLIRRCWNLLRFSWAIWSVTIIWCDHRVMGSFASAQSSSFHHYCCCNPINRSTAAIGVPIPKTGTTLLPACDPTPPVVLLILRMCSSPNLNRRHRNLNILLCPPKSCLQAISYYRHLN